MQTLIPFFQSYGYVAVFGILLLCGMGLPVPEDISLIAGGIISGLGYADVNLMLFICLLGVLLGDGIMYNLGRIFGERFFDKKVGGKIITHARYEAILQWFGRYGRWVLFAARFMPGLRAPIFVTAGVTRFCSFTVFMAIDGFAAIISVPVWVYIGYYGASNVDLLTKWVVRSKYGVLVILFVVAAVIGVTALYRRRLKAINGAAG
jgi:membrane protein DedA with SNARE-associated domain